MLLTLALVVLLASITVFFSQEFIGAFKKLFAIKGVPLFLPLIAASWLIFTFDYWALWGAYYYREMLETMLNFLLRIMPFQKFATPVSLIILLTVISILPVILLDLYCKRKTYRGYPYPNVTSLIILIVTSILLFTL